MFLLLLSAVIFSQQSEILERDNTGRFLLPFRPPTRFFAYSCGVKMFQCLSECGPEEMDR